MKIEVGKKYRMKDYPCSYEYVHILGKEVDLGISDGKSYYNDKENGVDEFYGVIIYKSGSELRRMPDMLSWGENGEWDGAFINDSNALVSEV